MNLTSYQFLNLMNEGKIREKKTNSLQNLPGDKANIQHTYSILGAGKKNNY